MSKNVLVPVTLFLCSACKPSFASMTRQPGDIQVSSEESQKSSPHQFEFFNLAPTRGMSFQSMTMGFGQQQDRIGKGIAMKHEHRLCSYHALAKSYLNNMHRDKATSVHPTQAYDQGAKMVNDAFSVVVAPLLALVQ